MENYSKHSRCHFTRSFHFAKARCSCRYHTRTQWGSSLQNSSWGGAHGPTMKERFVSISETQQGSLLHCCALPKYRAPLRKYSSNKIFWVSSVFLLQFFLHLHSFVFGHESNHTIRAGRHEGATGPRGILVIVLGRQPLIVLVT